MNHNEQADGTPNAAVESMPEEGSPESGPAGVQVSVGGPRLQVSTVAMATAAVLGVLLLAYVLYRSLNLLFLLFLSLLLATAIEPLVNRLRKGPLLSRSAGILIVYTGIFLVIAAIGYVTVPLAVSQAGQIGESLQRSVAEMQKNVSRIDNGFIRDQVTVFTGAAQTLVGRVQSTPANPSETVNTAASATLTVAEIFFAIVTVFVVAYYWLTERTLIKRWMISWLPARRANRVRRVWDDIEVKVGGWVRGQLTLMGIVGLLSAIGYFFIGVSYWPVLALFIAIAEAIPMVGPYLGTAPAVVIALTQPDGGLGKALVVVAFAVVLQMVEGNVLVPRIMRQSVGISPLAVILSLLLGSTLGGLTGALIAVPIAGAIQVIVSDIKAARQSEERLEAATEDSAETRLAEGELVVAYPAGGETRTHVAAGSEQH